MIYLWVCVSKSNILLLDAEEKEAMLQAKEEARVKRIYACLDDPTFLEKMRRRFKDDPRAEAFFSPKKNKILSMQHH
uniref:Uncharacterized protein n=1 Tax=Aegilops tauschii subsp. strangulata TaxID=200361 RepID=A0A453QX10_AEGTS